MQKEEPDHQEGPGADSAPETPWLLEHSKAVAIAYPNRLVVGPGPKQITVYADDIAVATLEGHTNSLEISSSTPEFFGVAMDFEHLFWTHTAVLRRLQGEPVMSVMGSACCVLRCKHRPIYYPRPGMDGLRIVVPRVNPTGLLPADIFQLAIRLGF